MAQLRAEFRMFVVFFVHALLWNCSKPEMFSSIAEMQSLVRAEREFLDLIENHALPPETPGREAVDRFASCLRDLHETAQQHGIFHPLAAFLHIKLFAEDMDKLLLTPFEQTTDPAVLKLLGGLNAIRQVYSLPDSNDLQGAAVAISRLQAVYQISANSFADGIIRSLPTHPRLSTLDCFSLAENLFFAEEFGPSAEWYRLVQEKCRDDQSRSACSPAISAEVLGRLSYLNYDGGNLTEAIQLAKEALQLDATNVAAQELLEMFLGEPDAGNNAESVTTGGEPTETLDSTASMSGAAFENDIYIGRAEDGRNYVGLCRNVRAFQPDPSSQTHLRCFFTSPAHPFLRIQPIKVEHIGQEPDIFLFHDFASSAETEHLVPLGSDYLERALIATREQPHSDGNEDDEASNLAHVTHTRTAKNAWFEHDHDDITRRLAHRIGAATGVDLNYAEPFQLANYGVGGHYDPHYDFFTLDPKSPTPEGKDERIATFMLYLSDVDAGGATAFIRKNITVVPQKGTAVFWTNLHRDGVGNAHTLHAGCPVLHGSKWVLNLWIKAKGHEFSMPCDVLPDSPFLKALPTKINDASCIGSVRTVC